MKKYLLPTIFIISGLIGLVYVNKDKLFSYFFRPTPTSVQQGITVKSLSNSIDQVSTSDGEIATLPKTEPLWGNLTTESHLADLLAEESTQELAVANPIQVVAQNLNIPWEITFLPDDSLLVTERPGNLVRIYPERRETLPVNGVVHRGEGGLLGLTLHPNFAQNNWIYLYLTSSEGDNLINRVERYTFDLSANTLSERQVILNNIPGAPNHDGGRIDFGPDGFLYITSGDAQNPDSAQNTKSLSGKILRVDDNGTPPTDNPFNNEVYSYGHRNPQGLAWDSQNRLWSSEHGPSGRQSGNDEVNLIQSGLNYGWPVIKGTQSQTNMVSPAIESGSNETWAPGDIAILNDKVFFTGLRGAAIYTGNITQEGKITNLVSHFRGDFGRIRASVIGPDQWLYITTSNKDGRGKVEPGDDKIIRINPTIFNVLK